MLSTVLDNLQQNWVHEEDHLEQQIQSALKILVPYTYEIPLPGHGQTFLRWQILSQIAQINLSLAKIFESHLDAVAIIQEVSPNYHFDPNKLWAVWAAEGGVNPLKISAPTLLNGCKNWCSAAAYVDQALMTYRDEQKCSQLIVVDLKQDGIKTTEEHWQAVGMQATQTAQVEFINVPIEKLGKANAYLDRAGFWHGAAGVAACWFGVSLAIAQFLKNSVQNKPHAYKSMYHGEIYTSILATKTLFKEVANLIDTQPCHSHELIIRALRAQVEQTALKILENVGKALGAAPYCNNAHFSRLAADLPVFIRQSHAAFDLEKIGDLAALEDDLCLD
ncbi:acyl-CoA dehydrogenase [Acinetobacter sp. NCu2D-2]|uniref:acyl-CoA dehydrogenase family protein n=1 Tax=Acinetobacter sp. NCu2D-2 TaxID=1608473 RepID=UPI0007CDAADE|nr:acyl-CoA dehydrogenase family protein [Acinetobacter sp. NCu2D-2]ANF81771.1 acyl-CoA dehydrogenase [Acinetobacter sp. NCu2D-2]